MASDQQRKSSLIEIEGPVSLRGEVRVRGAKNASLPILAAAALAGESVRLQNLPTELVDVGLMVDSLRHIGAEVTVEDGAATVACPSIRATSLPADLASSFRYSLLFLGLLVARAGEAEIPLPGGCKLGDRKFDLHVEGLRRLGAEVIVEEHRIVARAKKLKGADISFYLPTTSGTENVILAACFAEGRTRILNANTRPEIVDMANLLNAMGANITVRNRVVEIEGGRPLAGASHHIMSGWDEALTYVLAAGTTGGEVCVRDFTLEHVQGDVAYLREAGLDVFEWGGNVYATARNRKLRPFHLFTAPYPGVNSDMQPLFAAFASRAHGSSSVTDQRFTERFQYASELRKLGIAIESYGNCAVIEGPSQLVGTRVRALDLRCGAALVIAALGAEGTTTVENCSQIYRGYEHLVPRMAALGARIRAAASVSTP
jgi:UDP-N-acetylglucosamine 1-carboxyvinyltransferase